MLSRSLARIALAACALASPWLAPLSAQGANGTLTGKITDAANGQPVGNVQVSIVGTTLGALSNQDGVYVVRGIPAGAANVRAIRIGYSEARSTVTITSAQNTTLNLQLKAVPATLNPVVTTVTGEQRRVEVGNAIAQVNAENIVETKGVANVADLLTSRAAGVMVVPGVQTGAGVRVRIRGTSSIALTNNPIWVIDGIRVDGSTGSSSVSVGGTTPSRVGDLNPEEIESMEVVRGPSASTLYGTDAANGVIVIKTKRGVAGKPQWTYYTEQTGLQDRNQYPTAYRAWRTGTTATTNSTAANTVQCFLTQQAASACRADSLTTFNLHDDPETTPYGTGYRYQHGLQVKGGSDNVRYFLHGEYENEDGVTKVPVFEQRYLNRMGLSLLPEQRNPNGLKKITTRANLNITLSPKADVTVSSGFTNQNLRLPNSDDSGTAGIAANT